MRLLLLLTVVGLIIFLVSSFLAPNDLAKCAQQPSVSGDCQPADAIIAISGGDTAARTHHAIKLYQDGWAPILVLAGAAQDADSPSNAAVMRDIAINAGVPQNAIIIDEYSETTKQNASETANLLEGEEVSSVILVTSAYHQRRASLEFGRSFNGGTVRSSPVQVDNHWSKWWWLSPFGWYLALGELARIVMFYLGATR